MKYPQTGLARELSCFALLAIAAFGNAFAEEDSRPNVLLLLTDQQTMRAMSAYGNPHLHTPNMDRLARSGVRFDISYCAAPVCGPARSSILTGRLPHETGVNLNGQVPDPTIPNLGQVFRRAGYETAWSGKWHLPASYPRPPDATIPGFDYLHMPEGTQYMLGDQTDAAAADQAIAFLKRSHDRPWLLGVSLHNPHDICLWVRNEPIAPTNLHLLPPLPENFRIAQDESSFLADCRKPKVYGVEQQYTDRWDATQWRAYLYAYYRMTEQVDRCLGRILNVLRDRGLAERTLVVLTSDHGEGVAGHQLIVKLTPYDGASSVPLLIAWPEHVPAGVADDQHPVSAIDILPTICDYVDVESPALTGVTLRPWIDQEAGPRRPAVVCELSPFRKTPERKCRILRTRDFKYMAFTDGDRPEMLFDMRTDPGEMHNLAERDRSRDQLMRHRELLRQWIVRTQDDFTAPWME